jgi:hypothetical protein
VLTPALAKEIVELEFDAATQTYLDHLRQGANAGTLTPDAAVRQVVRSRAGGRCEYCWMLEQRRRGRFFTSSTSSLLPLNWNG